MHLKCTAKHIIGMLILNTWWLYGTDVFQFFFSVITYNIIVTPWRCANNYSIIIYISSKKLMVVVVDIKITT